MDIKKIIDDIRSYIENLTKQAANVQKYDRFTQPADLFRKTGIKVQLEACKDIILQDETSLELGGANKKSFSMVYPFHLLQFINDGQITLIGPEIKEVKAESTEFGLLFLIGFKSIGQKTFDNLRHFNFISNGIEGFMIRTIPRRFWCRISHQIHDRFTFEFLGNAIMHLYKEKFGDIIQSMELILINSLPKVIDDFTELIKEIREHLDKKWQEKIEEWKRRVDCDYDWECVECPYYDTCEDIQEVLEEREKIN